MDVTGLPPEQDPDVLILGLVGAAAGGTGLLVVPIYWRIWGPGRQRLARPEAGGPPLSEREVAADQEPTAAAPAVGPSLIRRRR